MKSLWQKFQDQLENEPLWVIDNFEQFKEWHDKCYKGAKR